MGPRATEPSMSAGSDQQRGAALPSGSPGAPALALEAEQPEGLHGCWPFFPGRTRPQRSLGKVVGAPQLPCSGSTSGALWGDLLEAHEYGQGRRFLPRAAGKDAV